MSWLMIVSVLKLCAIFQNKPYEKQIARFSFMTNEQSRAFLARARNKKAYVYS